jgi:uroporphyrinogen decarboxylase
MTSRERLVAALEHREGDRVPIDLNGTIVTALTRVPYERLRELLGLPPDPSIEVSHFAMDTVRAKDDVLDHYHVDTRAVGMGVPFGFREQVLPDGSLYDEYRLRWRRASYYWDVIEHPLATATLADLPAASWPDEHDRGRYAGMRAAVVALARTDKALVVDIPGLGPFEGGCFLRGHAEFCTDLHTDPAYACGLMDRIVDSMILIWGHILDEVGDRVQVVAQGDDVGMQSGTYISPAMYRKLVKPRQKRLFDFMAPGGGYVFFPSHNIQADVTPGRIDRVFSSALKHGGY